MGNVLEQILHKREIENFERQANQRTVMDIFSTYEKARQTNILTSLKKQEIDADLATKGLSFKGGQLGPDKDLLEALSHRVTPTLENIKGGLVKKYLEGGELTERQQSVLDTILNPKQSIVNEQGDIIGARPKGSVFQPKKKEVTFDQGLTQKAIDRAMSRDNEEDIDKDFQDIIKNKTVYEKAGVDVGAVAKYYLEHPLVKKNPSKFGQVMNWIKDFATGK